MGHPGRDSHLSSAKKGDGPDERFPVDVRDSEV
jgi:hypothetical protein